MNSHRCIYIHRLQENGTYENFGSIEYICTAKTINILMLNVSENERGRGYGYGLILLCLCNIIKTIDNAYYLTKIHLDDDSDGAMTTQSIYYKLGFRVYNKENSEIMQINFLRPSTYMEDKLHIYTREGHTEPETVYYKTILDLYQNTIKTDKFKNIVQNIITEVNDRRLKFNIYMDGNTTDLDISQCLNIAHEIDEHSHNTRSKKRRTT